MDRSFLSLAPVVQASRRFVCIRPLTYENTEEAKYLKSLFVGRSGEMENTTCAFLAPDGQRLLSRPARGLQQLFQDADSLAEWMNGTAEAIAMGEASRKSPLGRSPLPLVPTVRLAINVSAADNRPLVVLRAADPKERQQSERLLADLAAKEEFLGRFTFAVASGKRDLASIDGAGSADGVLLVQPDRFGQKGSVIARAAPKASAEQLAGALRKGAQAFHPLPAAGFDHVREGQRQQIFWETMLPVTDPLEAQARERTRWFSRPVPPPER